MSNDIWPCTECGADGCAAMRGVISSLRTQLEEQREEVEIFRKLHADAVGWHEAALKEIADLRTKLDEALVVMAPFTQSAFCKEYGGNVEGAASIVYARHNAILRIGDFRRAASFRALKEQEKP